MKIKKQTCQRVLHRDVSIEGTVVNGIPVTLVVRPAMMAVVVLVIFGCMPGCKSIDSNAPVSSASRASAENSEMLVSDQSKELQFEFNVNREAERSHLYVAAKVRLGAKDGSASIPSVNHTVCVVLNIRDEKKLREITIAFFQSGLLSFHGGLKRHLWTSVELSPAGLLDNDIENAKVVVEAPNGTVEEYLLHTVFIE